MSGERPDARQITEHKVRDLYWWVCGYVEGRKNTNLSREHAEALDTTLAAFRHAMSERKS